ncbi:hypothetical protein [Pseudoxanthomonas sp.]|jgi:hypothetical protein|uniref:hypothetical protein n=1 Tax=Pseudoxanthomonas sp. TaxID=1871049 RepID=UPI002E103482|nr:hypothetical protein [Pseudoxanthomonas sp.]
MNQMVNIVTRDSFSANAAPCRTRVLVQLLKQAASIDPDVLFPVMASLLHTHLDHDHQHRQANLEIRQSLDNLELLLALEIERLGLRDEVASVSHAAPG